MVGGVTGVERDVIPYGSVLGDRARLSGLNIVGMQRRGFSRDEIQALRNAYQMLFEGENGTFAERVDDVAQRFADVRPVEDVLDLHPRGIRLAASFSRKRGMAGKLGILAGAGELPLRVIEACRAVNRPIFVLGFEGSRAPAVVADVPHAWIRLGAAATGLQALRENGVDELLMVGGVRRPSLWRVAARLAHAAIHRPSRLWRASALGRRCALARDHRGVRGGGFRVVGVDSVLADLLAPLGCARHSRAGRKRPKPTSPWGLRPHARMARAISVRQWSCARVASLASRTGMVPTR